MLSPGQDARTELEARILQVADHQAKTQAADGRPPAAKAPSSLDVGQPLGHHARLFYQPLGYEPPVRRMLRRVMGTLARPFLHRQVLFNLAVQDALGAVRGDVAALEAKLGSLRRELDERTEGTSAGGTRRLLEASWVLRHFEVPRGGRVLDVSGLLSDELASQGYEVVTPAGPGPAARWEAASGLGPGAFDAVIATLEREERLDAAVVQAGRLLRPRGLLFVTRVLDDAEAPSEPASLARELSPFDMLACERASRLPHVGWRLAPSADDPAPAEADESLLLVCGRRASPC